MIWRGAVFARFCPVLISKSPIVQSLSVLRLELPLAQFKN